jgi:hypothetical protein
MNKAIKLLLNDIENYKIEIESCNRQIKLLQENCVHKNMKVSRYIDYKTMYEITCPECGYTCVLSYLQYQMMFIENYVSERQCINNV